MELTLRKLANSTGCLKSFVEIGCGKYITVVTSPFSIVLALIYPRHSPGGPGHSIGEVGGAHGGRQGHQGGHKERL